MLDAQCSMLNAPCSMLNAQCSILHAECSTLNARRSLRRSLLPWTIGSGRCGRLQCHASWRGKESGTSFHVLSYHSCCAMSCHVCRVVTCCGGLCDVMSSQCRVIPYCHSVLSSFATLDVVNHCYCSFQVTISFLVPC